MTSPTDPPAPSAPTSPEDGGNGNGMWGPSLVQRLACEVPGEGGSWMDPLFRETPPIAELPGLGERYQDLTFLGEGATATVFQATDTLLLRPVAIKVFKNQAWSTLQEGRAQAKVEHPNVCRVYEVGRGFLVMELIDGPTLQALRPELTQAQKAAIIRDVALGIHAAHQRDLVHLDLKPGNILVRVLGKGAYHPVVGDFGMVLGGAAPSGSRCPLGTPPFSSPEQLRGDPAGVDCRSDVYSIGMMLYVLLAGRPPFAVEGQAQLLEAIAQTPPEPLRALDPAVPQDLACIVNTCLAKDPAGRYPTALALAEDLDRFLKGEAVGAMPRSLHYRGGKWLRRNRWLAMLGAASALALLAVTVVNVRRDRSLAEREDWNHHFQLMVEELRADLERCYRKPLHDVEPEREAAHNLLQAIESGMKGSAAAAGPGHLAYGQALLIVSPNNPKAQEHFQKAWDLGFRTEAARAWLAYTLVTRQRDSLRGFDPLPAGEGSAASATQLMDQARQLLAGRGTTEQQRVAHLLDLADLATTKGKGSPCALEVARAYRRHFPNDLEAMLEEAQTTCGRALIVARFPPEARPAADGDPTTLIRAAEALARSILAEAPSYPEGYRTLVRVLIASDRLLSRSPEERRGLHGEIAHTFQLWRTVNPNSPDLPTIWLDYLCTCRLPYALASRTLPAFLGDLLAELPRALEGKDVSRLDLTLHAIGACASNLDRYGVPRNRLTKEATAFVLANEDRLADLDTSFFLAFALSSLSQSYFEAGGDPRRLDGLFPSGPGRDRRDPDPRSTLSHDLVVLEFLRVRGLDYRATLAHAEALLERSKLARSTKALYQVELASAAARATDTPQAWSALKEALDVVTASSSLSVDDLMLPMLIQAHLLLVRHALKAGIPCGPEFQVLDQLLETRFSCQTKRTRLFHALRAERLMLGACAEPSATASAALAEATREIDQAIQPDKVQTAPPPRFFGSLSLGDATPPSCDLQFLRGEILLQAASRTRTPNARAHDRLQARAAFRLAERSNPNLTALVQRVLENPGPPQP